MFIKMSKAWSARYYKKETQKSCERYQNLLKKNRKQEYSCERYKNLPENEKQRLLE